MKRFFGLLALSAIVFGCSDQSPTGMAADQVDDPNGEGNGSAPAAILGGAAPAASSGSTYAIDFREAGVWGDISGGAIAQSGGVQGTGAGVFPSFLLFGTAQGRDDGKGYNTDASGPDRQYEISGGSNTRSVPLNSVPTIARNDVIYREFRFDGQAPGAQDKQDYSIDEIRIYLVPNVDPNNAIPDFLESDVLGPRAATTGSGDPRLVWDMNAGFTFGDPAQDNWTWLWVSSAISSGQGASDLRLMVPNELFLSQIPQEDYSACAFDGFDYSAGGVTALDSECPWLVYFVSSHGFASSKESGNSEWSVAFRPTLMVTKTAEGKFDRSYDWSVEKSVDQDAFDLFRGDQATPHYTVEVTKGEPIDSNVRVEGEITIDNVSDESVTINAIRDMLTMEGLDDPIVLDFEQLECTGIDALPYTMEAEETQTCSYSVPLNAEDRGLVAVNDVIVTADDPLDEADDGTLAFAGFAPVTWATEPENVVNNAVDVLDMLGDVTNIDETITESNTFDYDLTFTCDEDEGTATNTVTITGDEDAELGSDESSVTIACHALDVSKTADTEYTRTFDWTIDKYAGEESSPTTDVGPLMPGQSFLLGYTVQVNTTGYTDSDWKVTGTITIHNPAPIDAVLHAVTDVVSPAVAADVDCGQAEFPYTLGSGGDLLCDYSADLPDGTSRTNTATATLQNHRFYMDEGTLTSEETGTTDFTGTKAVTFGDPTTLVNQCVDVTDAFEGESPARTLGTVCVPTDGPGAYESASGSFNYIVQFGGTEQDATADLWFAELVCDDNYFTNTAWFYSQSLDASSAPLTSGSASWTVDVYVNCAVGCTLTQGYWRTHNQYFRDIHNGNGPPLDEIWALVGLGLEGGVTGLGVESPFYLSGGTWGQAMWPEGSSNSNLYYQAASQWIAAYLNVVAISELDDNTDVADVLAYYPTVQQAWESGLALFAAVTPADIEGLKGKDASPIRAWRAVLAAFNEGDIGPGHCDEDFSSMQ